MSQASKNHIRSTSFSRAVKLPSEMTMFSVEKSSPSASITAFSTASSPGPPQPA